MGSQSKNLTSIFTQHFDKFFQFLSPSHKMDRSNGEASLNRGQSRRTTINDLDRVERLEDFRSLHGNLVDGQNSGIHSCYISRSDYRGGSFHH